MQKNEMLFQLGSSVFSVRVFCCFSLGSSVVSVLVFCMPPPPPDDKIGIRVTEKFWLFRFTFNKFQPKDNSVQSLLHLLQCSTFVMGNVPIGLPYTFTIYSIHVITNLPTKYCQTMWTIIFFTYWQCSSFVMGNVLIWSPYTLQGYFP